MERIHRTGVDPAMRRKGTILGNLLGSNAYGSMLEAMSRCRDVTDKVIFSRLR